MYSSSLVVSLNKKLTFDFFESFDYSYLNLPKTAYSSTKSKSSAQTLDFGTLSFYSILTSFFFTTIILDCLTTALDYKTGAITTSLANKASISG